MNTTLSIEIAEQFLNHAQVDLADFIIIEDAAAHALARHRGNLDLSGLKSLSSYSAHALAQHVGNLEPSSITNLDDSIGHVALAGKLASRSGHLDLSGLLTLSNVAGRELAQH